MIKRVRKVAKAKKLMSDETRAALMATCSGRKYAKTGDLSGDLCCKCFGFMVIYKWEKKNTLRCQGCGREVQFETDSLCRSAYK